MRIKLDSESIQYITLFEKVTKAMVKDCIPNNEKIIFVVNEGFAGIAIGRKGINIKNLEKMLRRKIEIIEFSGDPIKFLSNILRPFDMKNAYVSEKSDGKKAIHFSVNRSGPLLIAKIKKSRRLMTRYFGEMDLIKG